MSPKDLLTYAGLAASLLTGASAHFGVADKAAEAQRGSQNVEKLLVQHIEDSKEVHAARERDIQDVRAQQARDVEQLRADANVTRERVIVVEQNTRQTLDAVAELKKTLERSTVLVPAQTQGVRR